jgi:TusA-related sulfurtransferase
LKAKKALNDMVSGQVLKVIATDPGASRDFEAFAKQTGHELVLQEKTEAHFVFALKRR